MAKDYLGAHRRHPQLEVSKDCRRHSGPGSHDALMGAPELHGSGLMYTSLIIWLQYFLL